MLKVVLAGGRPVAGFSYGAKSFVLCQILWLKPAVTSIVHRTVYCIRVFLKNYKYWKIFQYVFQMAVFN